MTFVCEKCQKPINDEPIYPIFNATTVPEVKIDVYGLRVDNRYYMHKKCREEKPA